MTECLTCGHPQLRPAGHADWCAPHNERESAEATHCQGCGFNCTNPSGLGSHYRSNPHHRPAIASATTDSNGPAPAVESVVADGVASPHALTPDGEVGTEVGPSSGSLPGRSTHAKRATVRTVTLQNNAV